MRSDLCFLNVYKGTSVLLYIYDPKSGVCTHKIIHTQYIGMELTLLWQTFKTYMNREGMNQEQYI